MCSFITESDLAESRARRRAEAKRAQEESESFEEPTLLRIGDQRDLYKQGGARLRDLLEDRTLQSAAKVLVPAP